VGSELGSPGIPGKGQLRALYSPSLHAGNRGQGIWVSEAAECNSTRPTFVFALNLTALIAVCSLSWHFFEKKINDLKRFYPYVPPTAGKVGTVTT